MPQVGAVDVEVVIPRRGLAPAGAAAFASKGEPGGPGCCLWCGARLRGSKTEAIPEHDEHRAHRGDYADNAFCGLRCGYQFGLQMATIGRRLQRSQAQVPQAPAVPPVDA